MNGRQERMQSMKRIMQNVLEKMRICAQAEVRNIKFDTTAQAPSECTITNSLQAGLVLGRSRSPPSRRGISQTGNEGCLTNCTQFDILKAMALQHAERI